MLRNAWDILTRSARLMVGHGDYRAYCEHMAHHHPDAAVMDERAFFRSRQEARYSGRGGGRCC